MTTMLPMIRLPAEYQSLSRLWKFPHGMPKEEGYDAWQAVINTGVVPSMIWQAAKHYGDERRKEGGDWVLLSVFLSNDMWRVWVNPEGRKTKNKDHLINQPTAEETAKRRSDALLAQMEMDELPQHELCGHPIQRGRRLLQGKMVDEPLAEYEARKAGMCHWCQVKGVKFTGHEKSKIDRKAVDASINRCDREELLAELDEENRSDFRRLTFDEPEKGKRWIALAQKQQFPAEWLAEVVKNNRIPERGIA